MKIERSVTILKITDKFCHVNFLHSMVFVKSRWQSWFLNLKLDFRRTSGWNLWKRAKMLCSVCNALWNMESRKNKVSYFIRSLQLQLFLSCLMNWHAQWANRIKISLLYFIVFITLCFSLQADAGITTLR